MEGKKKMKIAIVDDERYWRECAANYAKQFYEKSKIHIDIYTSGADFIKKEEKYDIVIMDIEMPDKDGFQTLQEYKIINESCISIILTTHSELSNKGYRVDAFRYVDKTNMKEELKEAFESAGKLIEGNTRIIFNVVNLGQIQIPVKDIVFIETIKRNIMVHTTEDEYECSDNISDLELELEEYGFYRSHRSYLVNLDKVKTFDKRSIYFAKNKEACLSSRKYKEMKQKYLERKIVIASM